MRPTGRGTRRPANLIASAWVGHLVTQTLCHTAGRNNRPVKAILGRRRFLPTHNRKDGGRAIRATIQLILLPTPLSPGETDLDVSPARPKLLRVGGPGLLLHQEGLRPAGAQVRLHAVPDARSHTPGCRGSTRTARPLRLGA